MLSYIAQHELSPVRTGERYSSLTAENPETGRAYLVEGYCNAVVLPATSRDYRP